jgi:hypothetical protein
MPYGPSSSGRARRVVRGRRLLNHRSARPSTDGGIVRRRAFAVLALMSSSNLAGCSTGRSPALAPRKTLSTKYAARRHNADRLGRIRREAGVRDLRPRRVHRGQPGRRRQLVHSAAQGEESDFARASRSPRRKVSKLFTTCGSPGQRHRQDPEPGNLPGFLRLGAAPREGKPQSQTDAGQAKDGLRSRSGEIALRDDGPGRSPCPSRRSRGRLNLRRRRPTLTKELPGPPAATSRSTSRAAQSPPVARPSSRRGT